MSDFIIYSGSEGQSLIDSLVKDGRPLDLTDSTVSFNLRHAISDELKVTNEPANVVDAEGGIVKYDWTDPDIDTPGEYIGWWKVVQQDLSEIDTAEFSVVITEHSPGLRARTGAIYRRAKSIIPISWNALETSDKYGDALLQETIEEVKLRIYGSGVPDVDDEVNIDIRVQSYLAKLTVLSVIPAAVDYWMDQPISIGTNPTQEITSYESRVDALWEIHERLLADVNKTSTELEEILEIPNRRPLTGVPGFSPGTDEGYRTPLPNDNFRDYAFPEADPWGWD